MCIDVYNVLILASYHLWSRYHPRFLRYQQRYGTGMDDASYWHQSKDSSCLDASSCSRVSVLAPHFMIWLCWLTHFLCIFPSFFGGRDLSYPTLRRIYLQTELQQFKVKNHTTFFEPNVNRLMRVPVAILPRLQGTTTLRAILRVGTCSGRVEILLGNISLRRKANLVI